MVTNLTDSLREAQLLDDPARWIRQAAAMGPTAFQGMLETQQSEMKARQERLGNLANVGFAIFHRLPPLFSEQVSTPWFKVVEHFLKYANDPVPTPFIAWYERAMEVGSAALLAASKEMDLPYKQTALMQQLERKHAAPEDGKSEGR